MRCTACCSTWTAAFASIRARGTRLSGAPRSGRLAATICRATDSALPATIELALPAGLGGGSTRIELGDWRGLHGVQLPFAADPPRRRAAHLSLHRSAALPSRSRIHLAGGARGALRRLGDLAALASAHERTLAAHRQSDVRILLADAADAASSPAGALSGRPGAASSRPGSVPTWKASASRATRMSSCLSSRSRPTALSAGSPARSKPPA